MQSSIQLSETLFYTAQAVRQVLSGQSLTEVLNSFPKEYKASVQSISFYCMRHLASAQLLSQQLLNKKAPNPLVNALLLVGLCLLTVKKRPVFSEKYGQSIPHYQEFTIVDETLKAAQKHKKSASFKGLLNACLRRYLREQDVLWERVQHNEVAQFDYSQWWIDAVKSAYPSQWQMILKAADIPGPLTLRVNRRKMSREAFSQQLSNLHIAHRCYGEDAVILENALPVQEIPGFDQGVCAVQDAGAQLAASLVPWQKGWRVLDACAAPGGKTAHILEREDVLMTALDIEPRRLARVEQNLKHLGLFGNSVKLVQADASQMGDWWDGQLFDAIMADVPCTASGIVRRHPDIKLLRQARDVPQTATLQRKIVKNLWPLLKPGGYFLYITCSIFPQEGVQQARWIEQQFHDALRLEAPGQLLPLATEQEPRPWHDGFFYALFQKAKEV